MCQINAHVKSVIPASFLGMSAMLLTNKSRLLMSPFNRSWALQSQQKWVSEWGSNPQISKQSFGLTLLLFTQKFKSFIIIIRVNKCTWHLQVGWFKASSSVTLYPPSCLSSQSQSIRPFHLIGHWHFRFKFQMIILTEICLCLIYSC